MLFLMQFQRSLSAKRSNAICKRANQFVHLPVHHEEMIYHPFIRSTISATNWTKGLATISLQMSQQMQPKFVVSQLASLEAKAAGVDCALGSFCLHLCEGAYRDGHDGGGGVENRSLLLLLLIQSCSFSSRRP